jgi:hypothetical protein
MLKLYSLTVFFLLNGLICYVSLSKFEQTTLILSFFIHLVCITVGLNRAVTYKNLNLDVVIWFFVYTFFFLAPIVQVSTMTFFPNSLPIDLSYVVKANVMIVGWHLIYLFFRHSNKPKSEIQTTEIAGPKGKTLLETANWKIKTVYFVLAVLIFLLTFGTLQFQYFLGYVDYSALTENKSILLIMTISFAGIVFANWLFAFAQFRENRSLSNLPYVLASSLILFYQINPFNANRFYIGFCLILVLYVFYYRRVTSGKFIFYIFLGLFVFFPFLNIFRYGFKTFEMPNMYDLMFSQLTELHFDAYSNIIATLQYCESHGFAMGYQMLGVLFFFVPRTIWISKPLSSGEALGDFIATSHALKMNNISNPIISEFYINFGIIGVLAGAWLMACFVNKLESTKYKNRLAYSLVAGYFFMIFRGDLMSAFAYCFGTYIVMVFIPSKMNLKNQTSRARAVNRRVEYTNVEN